MIAVLLLAAVPCEDATTVYATTLEINHVFDGERFQFSQLIVWQGGECRDWRMLSKSGRPRYRWATRQWEVEWMEGGRVVCVRATHFRETWTQYDRELESREVLPQELRVRINRKPESGFDVWNAR